MDKLDNWMIIISSATSTGTILTKRKRNCIWGYNFANASPLSHRSSQNHTCSPSVTLSPLANTIPTPAWVHLSRSFKKIALRVLYNTSVHVGRGSSARYAFFSCSFRSLRTACYGRCFPLPLLSYFPSNFYYFFFTISHFSWFKKNYFPNSPVSQPDPNRWEENKKK